MRKVIIAILLLAATLLTPFAPAAQAATSNTYGDFSMMFAKRAGQYVGGQWAWVPQSATESRISWGNPNSWPPSYSEQFVRDGDWVMLRGWFDNGTFYQIQTRTEWRANADCVTDRIFLPTGGAEHYALWAIPATAYCTYSEGTVTELASGAHFDFVHQQVWTPPAACPKLSQPILDLANKPVAVSDCIAQRESYADANGTPLATKVDRTVLLARGVGMAYKTTQTKPVAWSSELRSAWAWG